MSFNDTLAVARDKPSRGTGGNRKAPPAGEKREGDDKVTHWSETATSLTVVIRFLLDESLRRVIIRLARSQVFLAM